ncbi:MAG: class I mannose-6-phosphate isomerase [Verrucomicrobia bacterium]|nr:class I mannose-6-phosphate isomerase [Verrucomicrobiota bacterium]
MLYPLTFRPIFKERIWGGRNLERLYGKALPKDVPIGESWEISDRPDDENIISNGPLAGKSLHWLMEHHRPALLGSAQANSSGRFPLLIKILDAQEKLSLQVHPPAAKVAELGGEPKTEMWFIADATPAADLFVGLKRGTTRTEFEQKIGDGSVAECFHHILVKPGDAIFLPSGRVHAIGAGNVIFEIQQNSDTTYRVFDWNRVDARGKPRELHVEKSLDSIDFNDFEPPLISNVFHHEGSLRVRELVTDPLFKVEQCEADTPQQYLKSAGAMQIFGVLKGSLQIENPTQNVSLRAGNFCLVPASENATVKNDGAVSFLRIHAGV